MKNRSIVKIILLAWIIVISAIAANAGAILKVNWVGPGNTCDGNLTLEEAALLGEGAFSRSLSTAEKNQISGANFILAPPGPCGAVLWFATTGVGFNSADDIVFANGLTAPISSTITLGINDDIDGTTGSSKVILDGTGFIPGFCGIFMATNSGSQIRNLEIRNFPSCGIHAFATSGGIFEGLDIHNNGTHGIDLGFQGGSTITNSRNTRIGGDQPQHRNRIFANGGDGISIVSSPTGDRFPDQGIFILNNLIGTSDGLTDNGNNGNGISLVNAFGVIIGDSTSATRNIISGNNNDGVTLSGPGAISNVIIYNFIGSSESSGARLGNSGSGIALLNSAGSTADFISTGPNKIGMPGLGNVISANNVGIFIADPNTSLNRIQGNLIGTNVGGNTDLGNNADGIYFVNGTFNNQVGGTGASEGNLIAFNRNGIRADSGVRNSFRRNRIFSNDLLGIDLAPVGVTPNDPGDVDSGPNNLQNFPVIVAVNAQASSVTLEGSFFNNAPNQTFTIDFYGNSAVDASGYGEGRNFIGSTQVTTDAGGGAIFFGLNFPSSLSNTGQWVTATATDANGNTSEFSQAKNICASMGFSPESATAPGGGGGANFTIIYSAGCSSYTAQSSVSWITVNSVLAGTVTYTVAANTGPARNGLVNINYNNGTGSATAGFSVFQTQNSGCTYPYSHFSVSYPASGTNFDGMSVGAGVGCTWTAVSNAPWINITSGVNYSGFGTVTWSVPANNGPARQGTLTIAGQTFTVNQAGASSRRTPFDFDGDGKTDIAIFRPLAAAEWWVNRSSTGVTFALQFGASTDRITPADYTGDGKADIAFFRPASGEWYVLRSENFSFFALPFGTNGDVPVPADYDADGKADFAVFRPSSATWFISQSSGAPTQIVQFGINGDQPVVSDYDGDGKADVAIYRPGPREWWIQRSTAGPLAIQFGNSSDKPVQGDYTGDGKSDIAIWRPSTGEWLIVRSENFSFYGFPFGTTGDTVAPGDYDGDGKFDATVFRPSNSTWFIARSTAGTQIVQFGATGDRPIPNSFVP